MSIRRWDPFKELDEFHSRMTRLFDEVFGKPTSLRPERAGEWSPCVDVFETDKEFVIKADLPGLDKKDVEIEVKNNILTIKGEKKKESELKEGNYYVLERSFGTFSRSFNMPDIADTQKTSAKFKNGILELKIPKKESVKPVKVKIEAEE